MIPLAQVRYIDGLSVTRSFDQLDRRHQLSRVVSMTTAAATVVVRDVTYDVIRHLRMSTMIVLSHGFLPLPPPGVNPRCPGVCDLNQ